MGDALGSSHRPMSISCFDPSYCLIRDVTGGIRADHRASERGGGANLSESPENVIPQEPREE